MVTPVLNCDESASVAATIRRKGRSNVPGARIELDGIRNQSIDFGHGGDGFAFDFRGAACDQQPCVRPSLSRAAYRLPGLANRLSSHRTRVDHDNVLLVR
jgi:hypothetical protein